ncbi:MAG: hypothetical protein COA78_06580 [Blastopirellula sp.]|nr:MAG: hypothetical protein COA78_06580 [Blastopirellula sp.]
MTNENLSQDKSKPQLRLAIIGGGSSGLISLKNSLDLLPDWEIVCFEKSDQIIGCWGNPYPQFVSTSTKYTTQFACFPKFDALCLPDHGASRSEFFRDDEYGQYLEEFADEFALRSHIKLKTSVENICRDAEDAGWNLTIRDGSQTEAETREERFDHVILCTGLAAQPKQIDSEIESLSVAELNHAKGLSHIKDKKIVVIGGGESAVDYANRLARPELKNEVYLSLKSGIRVSPRYHPIRSVPSDFLRNRLMLSIHPDIRNWIGQRFVEWRIQYQETFEWLFPKSKGESEPAETSQESINQNRKDWAYKLTKTAKDDLFNMFHNKSDDFLDAVGDDRISIIGESIDNRFTTFHEYDSDQEIEVRPDLIVPAVGYRSILNELSEGEIQLPDFYLGCCHVNYSDLFLVGFARPIIGNIPTISEVQAQFVCGMIDGKYQRPEEIEAIHRADSDFRKLRYKNLNRESVYPVEMFPYCDHLTRLMHTFPTVKSVGSLFAWCRMQLAPATTLHYLRDETAVRDSSKPVPIYMPPVLIAILLVLKPISWFYSACSWIRQRLSS